jgi:hypothetical protein
MSPTIGLSYTTRISPDIFTEFERLVAAEGLGLHVEQREEDGPFAAFEWLVPTVVVLFIAKAYFDGFLKEMGKDHYALLKAGLKSLYSRLVGPSAPQIAVVSAGGKRPPISRTRFFFLSSRRPTRARDSSCSYGTRRQKLMEPPSRHSSPFWKRTTTGV